MLFKHISVDILEVVRKYNLQKLFKSLSMLKRILHITELILPTLNVYHFSLTISPCGVLYDYVCSFFFPEKM